MLDVNDFTNSINSNDKQKMFDETKKIGSITSEIYQKLSEAGIDKSKIDQKIILVEKTDIDNKFVSWLKEQMPNFVDGINYEELKGSSLSVDQGVNPFTGEASTPDAVPVNDVFGTPDANADATANETTPPVEETTNVAPSTPEPVSEQPTPESQPVPEPQPASEPQPVSNVEEGTNVAPVADNNAEEVHEIDKKSGGFANLLILFVILVVVTVASIELGKFLYNTFGA